MAAQRDNMFLYEFDQDSVVISKIVALINQIKQDIDHRHIDPENYTVDQLLSYFQKYDVILDVNDLYSMIKVPPLKELIDNIQGDKVVFKGFKGEENSIDAPPQDNKKTVAQMAKRASKF